VAPSAEVLHAERVACGAVGDLVRLAAALVAGGAVLGLLGLFPVAFLAAAALLARPAFTSTPAACVLVALTSPVVALGSLDVGFHLQLSYVLIAAGLAGAVWRREHRHVVWESQDLLLGGFVAIAAVVTFANVGLVPDTPVPGATGANSHALRGPAQLLAVVAMAGAYALLRAGVRQPAELLAVVRALLVATAGVALYAGYQVVGRVLDLPYTFINERRTLDALPQGDGYIRINSTLPEASPLAQFAAIALLVGVAWLAAGGRARQVPRWVAGGVACGGALLVAATLSKAAFVAIGCCLPAMLFVLARGCRARVAIAVAGILGFALVSLAVVALRGADLGAALRSEESLRAGYWRAAAEIVERHPLGVGVGNYTFHYPLYAPLSRDYEYFVGIADAHNLYLEAFAETGVLGGLLLVAFVVTLLVRGIALARDIEDRVLQATLLALTFAFAVGVLMHLTSSFFYYPFEWVLAGAVGSGAAVAGRGPVDARRAETLQPA